MNRIYPNTRRRGLISIEFISALLLILATLVLFLDVTAKRIRVANTLANDRAATRMAERTLLSMRRGGVTQGGAADGVTIRKLSDPAPVDHAWIEIEARIGPRSATLVGLVPVKEAP